MMVSERSHHLGRAFNRSGFYLVTPSQLRQASCLANTHAPGFKTEGLKRGLIEPRLLSLKHLLSADTAEVP